MSAVVYELPYQQAPSRPRLELVADIPATTKSRRSVYRRRRIVAAIVATFVVLAASSVLTQGLSWAWDQVSGRSVAVVSASTTSSAPQITEWTIRPGDTIWGIANSVQNQGDIRPLVHKLTKQYGNKPLVVGETIAIPQ